MEVQILINMASMEERPRGWVVLLLATCSFSCRQRNWQVGCATSPILPQPTLDGVWLRLSLVRGCLGYLKNYADRVQLHQTGNLHFPYKQFHKTRRAGPVQFNVPFRLVIPRAFPSTKDEIDFISLPPSRPPGTFDAFWKPHKPCYRHPGGTQPMVARAFTGHTSSPFWTIDKTSSCPWLPPPSVRPSNLSVFQSTIPPHPDPRRRSGHGQRFGHSSKAWVKTQAPVHFIRNVIRLGGNQIYGWSYGFRPRLVSKTAITCSSRSLRI